MQQRSSVAAMNRANLDVLAKKASAPKVVVDPGWEDAEWNHIRRVGIVVAVLFVFIRVTYLHELIAAKLGVNTYMLYLFGPPAILCTFLSGGLQRILRQRQGVLWFGFLLFFLAAALFSHWRASSFGLLSVYVRTDFILLPVVAGLALTWRDFWRLVITMACAGITSIVFGVVFAQDLGGGRSELSFGTMSNANDFAAHLTLVLPFVALLVFTRRNPFIRLLAAGLILVGVYRILSTGSRGAFVALLVTLGFVLLRASLRQRIAMVLGVCVCGLVLTALLPGAVTSRLMSLFRSDEEEIMTASDAYYSRQSRTYLLKRSLFLTITHPIFGVGPGQFAEVENVDSQARTGIKGAWHETHNAYTQVSSEAGIPAALFYIGAIGSTMLLLNRVHRKALRRSGLFSERVAIASYCVMISLVGFAAACFFLSLAYEYYFPLLSAIAMVMANAAEHEWKLEDSRKDA